MAPTASGSRPGSSEPRPFPRVYPSGMTLPGPSKTIVVEPIEQPVEVPEPEPEPVEAPEPEKAPAK
jgi:hypothetical protein